MHNHCLFKAEPLFIKPLYYPGEIIFSRFSGLLQKEISFRSFDLDLDLEMIHRWVNMDYTRQFWRLSWTKDKLYELYYSIQRNSNGHSYIGLLDRQPVCQFDVYRVLADEIARFMPTGPQDCGFHLLMAPNTNPVPGLSLSVITSYLDYFFSFPQATAMYAEPDIHNHRSNQLVKRAGFRFQHQILMSYKTANLYSITKEQFHAYGHPVFSKAPAI
jgi:hypothetical protein